MMTMREREIYPNPPIVLMAVEVRHSPCEPLDRKQVSRLSALMRDWLPLPGEVNVMSVEVQGGAGVPPTHQQTIETFPRWTTRDRRTALTVRPTSLLLETTKYGSYERIRALLGAAARARVAIAPPAGIERIGLRYIDEIRVPLNNGEIRPAWGDWVHPALLGPVHIGENLGLTPAASEGAAVYSGENNRALVLRQNYGAPFHHRDLYSSSILTAFGNPAMKFRSLLPMSFSNIRTNYTNPYVVYSRA
jgi:uncharacterized protein (TIGR04255 family)